MAAPLPDLPVLKDQDLVRSQGATFEAVITWPDELAAWKPRPWWKFWA